MKKSQKQFALESKIKKMLSGKSLEVAELIFQDEEIQAIQDYANTVSIKRLGYNDHGPVHMRKTALNAMKFFDLLNQAGVMMNLEKENIGSLEDSRISVLIASLLHDLGMTITRANHEFTGITIAYPIINKLVEKIYPDNIQLKVVVRAMVLEGIFGHMATQPIHSLEAGMVLIADGCDMEWGRARITSLLSEKPKVGDIHRYSASAIKGVNISAGEEKPIKIVVEMSQSAGIFQVEEVLFTKVKVSPVKKYIELYAQVRDKEVLKYL